ncbi:MAG: two-component sensor histidine kinase [Saprospiraceae bacterium]|jgi:two-component sensor histidine kinase
MSLYPSFCLNIVRTGLAYIVIFFVSQLSIAQSAEYVPITEKEVIQLKAQIKIYQADKKWAECESLVLKIIEHYKGENTFDSVYYYNEFLSLVGKNSGNANIEMQGYLDRISQDRMFKSGSRETYRSNVEFVANNLHASKLRPKVLSQAYESHSSYLFDQNLIDSGLIMGKLSVVEADKSDVPIVKISARLRYGHKLQFLNLHEEKLNLLLEAEKIADNFVPDPVFQFRIYKDIGSILFNINDLDKAEYYIDKAMNTADAAGYSLFRADIEVLKARLLAKREEYDLSLVYFNKAIEKYKEVKYKKHLSIVYVRLGDMHLEAGQYSKAKISLDTSLDYADEESLNYNCVMAQYNLVTNNLSEVKLFLDKYRYDPAMQTSYADLFYSIEYQYFKKNKSYSKALEIHETYIITRDSIRDSDKEIKIHRVESEFNRDKQDFEIKTLNQINVAQDKALSIKNTALVLGGIMLFVLGALLFFLYRLYVKNQESQTELAIQNKKVSEALAQNQILIKEIHHRVKNNLQVVSSLLSMQARNIKDGETKDALNSSKTRVQSMSILHQNLYQGENLIEVNIDEYLAKLVDNIVDTYRIQDNIEVNVDIDSVFLDIDTLVPLGLIANELICNALKYAFIGRTSGVLDISFKEEGGKLRLRISDNGVGFEGDKLPKKEGSLGARLIDSFTERLEGEIIIDKSNGTDISIIFERNQLGLDK